MHGKGEILIHAHLALLVYAVAQIGVRIGQSLRHLRLRELEHLHLVAQGRHDRITLQSRRAGEHRLDGTFACLRIHVARRPASHDVSRLFRGVDQLRPVGQKSRRKIDGPRIATASLADSRKRLAQVGQYKRRVHLAGVPACFTYERVHVPVQVRDDLARMGTPAFRQLPASKVQRETLRQLLFLHFRSGDGVQMLDNALDLGRIHLPPVVKGGKHLCGSLTDSEIPGIGQHCVLDGGHRLPVDRLCGPCAEEARKGMFCACLVQGLACAVKDHSLAGSKSAKSIN